MFIRKADFKVESLEQRILLSADPVGGIFESSGVSAEPDRPLEEHVTVHEQLAQESGWAASDSLFDAAALLEAEAVESAETPISQAEETVNGVVFAISGTDSETDYNTLTFEDTIALAGSLTIELSEGFVPAVGDTFTLVSAPVINGAFTDASGLFGFDGGLFFQLTQDADSVDLTVKELSLASDLAFISDLLAVNDQIGLLLNAAYFGAPTGAISIDASLEAGPFSVSGTFSVNLNAGDLVLNGSDVAFAARFGDKSISSSDLAFGLRLSQGAGYALSATGTASLDGFDSVGLDGVFTVELNRGDTSVVDFGDYGSVDFGTTDSVTRFSGEDLEVSISGFANLRGALGFEVVSSESGSEVSVSGEAVSIEADLGGSTAPSLSLSGATLSLLLKEDGTFALVTSDASLDVNGLGDLAFSGTLNVAVNTTGEALVDLGGEDPYDFGTSNPTFEFAGDDIELEIADFFAVSGSIAFRPIELDGQLSGGDAVALEGFVFGGTNLSGFAGINRGSADEVGLTLDGIEFGLAFLNEVDGTNKWISLEGSAASAAFSGVEALTLAGSDIALSINTLDAGNATEDVIDYGEGATSLTIATGGETELSLTMAGELGELVGVSGSFQLLLADYFTTSGSIAFSRSSSSITLDDASSVDVDVLAVGGIGLSAFAGINASRADRVGFDLSGVTFALVLLEESGASGRNWVSLEATAESVGLVGIDGIGVSGSNLLVEVNLAASDGSVVDYATDSETLPLSLSSTETYILGMDGSEGELFRVGGTLALGVADFFRVEGSFALESLVSSVTLDDSSDVNVDVLAFGGSGLTAFAGVEESGFALENVSFGLYAAIDQDDPKRQWIGLSATVGSAGLTGVDGVTAIITDLSVEANIGAYDNSLIDFEANPVDVPVDGIGTLLTLAHAASEGQLLRVLATMELNFFDFFHVAGSFAVQKNRGYLSLSDGESVEVDALAFGGTNLSAFAGLHASDDVNRVGFLLEDATFAVNLATEVDGDGIFTSVEASVSSAGLVGVPEAVINGSDLSVFINRSSDERYADFSSAEFSIPVGPSSEHVFTMDGSEGALTAVSGAMSIDLAGLVAVSGAFALRQSVGEVTLFEADGPSEASVLTLGASDVSIFAGYNNDTPDAVGLSLQAETLAIALVSPSDTPELEYLALKAAGGSASLVGFEGITAEINSAVIELNTAAGDNSIIDFASQALEVETGPETTASIDFDGGLGELLRFGGEMTLEVAEFLNLSGGFFFAAANDTINLSGPVVDETDIAVRTLSLGGSGLSAFAGIAGGTEEATGFAVSDLDFALVIFNEDGGAARQWMTTVGTLGSAGLIGLDNVSATLTGATLTINSSASDGSVVNYNENTLDVATSPSETITLDVDGSRGDVLELAGTAALQVAEFFSVSGSLTLTQDSGEAILSNGETVSVDRLLVGGSGLGAFAGVNAGTAAETGLSLSDTDFALAIQSDDSGKTYTTLEASVASVGLVGVSDVTISGSNIGVRVNEVDSGDVVIDYGPDGTQLSVPTSSGSERSLTLLGEDGQQVGAFGSVSINIANFVQIDGTVQFERKSTTVRVTGESENRTVQVLSIGASAIDAFVGTNGGSVDEVGVRLSGLSLAVGIFSDVEAGQVWTAVTGTTDTLSLMGVDAVEATASALSLEVNLASEDGGVLNFAEVPVNLPLGPDTEAALEFDGELGELQRVSGEFDLNIADFVTLSGAVGIELSSRPVRVTDAVEDTQVDMLTIVGSGLSAFAGANAGTEDAFGVSIDDLSFALLVASETDGLLRSWTSFHGAVGSASILGLDGVVELSAGDLSVELNSEASDGTVLDFATTSIAVEISDALTHSFDFDGSEGELARIRGELSIAVSNFFSVSGSFGIESRTANVRVAGETDDTSVSLLTVAGTNVDAFAGLNAGTEDAVGLSLEGVGFAIVLASEPGVSGRNWTTVTARAASVSFVGLPEELALSASSLDVAVNLGASDASVLDYATTPLSVQAGPASLISVDLDGSSGELIEASGSFDLELFGYLNASGEFSFRKSTAEVAVVDVESPVEVDILTIGGAGLDVFAGLNAGTDTAIGLQLQGVEFGLAILTSTDDPAESWTALSGSADSFSAVGVEGLNLATQSLSISVNTASDSGAMVNFSESPITIGTGDSEVTLELDGTLGESIEITGALELNLLGLGISGNFAFIRTMSSSGSAVVALIVDNVSIGSYSGEGTDGATISITDAKGLLVLDEAGLAGSLSFKASIGFGPFEAGSGVYLRMNSTGKSFYFNTPFGEVAIAAGVYTKLDFADLAISIPGVEIEGSFSVMSDTDGGGQIIAGESVTIFVGTSTLYQKVGLQLENGSGLLYMRDEKTAASITGTVTLYGVPGLQFSAQMTVNINGFREALDIEADVNGESVTLALSEDEIASASGESFIQFLGTNLSLDLLGAFLLEGDLAITRSGSDLLIGSDALTLFAGDTGVDSGERIGLALANIELGAYIPTEGSGFAISASGNPQLLGVSGIDFGESVLLGFRYNSIGEDIEKTIPTAGGNFMLAVGRTDSTPLFFGNAEIDLGGFISLSGEFAIQYHSSPEGHLVIGFANVEVFAGGGTGSDRIGILAEISSLGVYVDLTESGGFALDGVGAVSLVGLDGLSIGGTASVRVNTTGKSVNSSIVVPSTLRSAASDGESRTALAVSSGISVSFPSADQVVSFGGSLSVSIPGLLDISGTATIDRSPSGRVDIALTDTSFAVSAFDTELFSLSGEAFFSIDPVSGFNLDDFYINGFSILGEVGVELPSTSENFAPEAELVSPVGGESILLADLIDVGTVDIFYSVRGADEIDASSITDSAPELVLVAGSIEVAVGGEPELVGVNTYRYTIDPDMLSALTVDGFEEWRVEIGAGSFSTLDGAANDALSLAFYVTDGTSGTTAELDGNAGSGEIDVVLLNGSAYIDIAFTDHGESGLNVVSILDSDPEFYLSGSGVLDAGVSGALSGAPTDLGNGVFRYKLTDLTPDDDVALFGPGEVQVTFVSGAWSTADGTLGTEGSSTFVVLADSAASAESAEPISLGPLSLLEPALGIEDFAFVDGQLSVTLAITAESIDLGFGDGAVTTSVKKIAGTFDLLIDALGFLEGAGSIVPSGKWSLTVGELELAVDGIIEARATGIEVGYDPNYDPAQDTENERSDLTGQTLLVVEEISVTIPVIGLTGSVSPYDPDGAGPAEEIPGLVVWENGFRIGTATLTYGVDSSEPGASAASSSDGNGGTIGIGGIIEFDDIRVGITNFEVIAGQEFSFDGDIFIASGGASFFPGSAVSASFRDRTSGTALSGKSEAEDTEAVRAVLEFTDGSPSGFVFYADTFQISFGSVLQITAEDLYINTSASASEEVVSFASIGAALNVGPLSIKGEARNFAFLGDGTFVAKQGFGVFFGGSEDGSSALGLPSWLPLYIDVIGVEWPDINNNPADFLLTISGGVKEIEGIPGAKFSGSVEGLKIDVGLLLEGRFPIVDLGAFTVGIKANVFGGELSGTIVAGLLKIGTDGEAIPVTAPSDTEVVDRVMYLGIQGGFDMAGLALTIRFAVSELGPLGVVVGISIPGGILLDVSGTTGLSMNDFVGGVEFYKSLPDLTEAKQLRDPSLRLATQPDPDQWLDVIKEQVVLQWQTVQANPGLGGFFGAFTQPMIISGSAKIFTAYASQETFNGQVEIQISTDGKILAIGTLNFLGDNLSISAALYANLSKILDGTGTFLFLATVPDQFDILEIGGEFSFGFTGPGGEPVTIPAFILTDEGIVPAGEAPRAKLVAPIDGATIDIVDMGAINRIGVTYLPGTGAELDVSTLNDADTVFTITGPNGSWQVGGPGVLEGVNYYYDLPSDLVFEPGEYTVTFAEGTYSDTAGVANEVSSATFTIRAVYASIVNFRDGGRMSLSEARAIGSLDFYVGPTRGSSVEEGTILDEEIEWTVVDPNGTRYPIVSKAVSLGGGQFGLSLPTSMSWQPGEWTFELAEAGFGDSAGFTNAAVTYSLLVDGAEGRANLNAAGVSISTLNGKGYLDVTYTGAAGAVIDVASILDASAEFELTGSAVQNVSLSDGEVIEIGNGIFRYPFTGEFTTGDFEINFAEGTWTDAEGTTNFSNVESFTAVELGGTLVEPRAFDVAERNQINSRQYLLVAFDDPLGVGMNEASITDNGLEFRLSGDGVGTAVLSGAATKVDVDGETFWKYPFSGSFEEGLVTVDFLEGNWSDNNGNLGGASEELISVYRQSSSFYISLGGFVELEAAGLTPDYDGNGEPDPLLLMKGEVVLTFEEVVDEVTYETVGLLMNLQVSATLEMFYLGNIGSAAANLTVGFGNVNAGGGLFGENTIALWGAIKIQSNLGFLENIGVKANAEMMLYVNSTTTDRTEVLTLEGIPGDVIFTFNDAGIIGSLPATAAPGDYQDDISAELRSLLDSEGLVLSDNLRVQGVVNGSKWRIIDNGDGGKMYFIERDDETGDFGVSSEAQTVDLPGLTFAIEAKGELIIGDLLSLYGEFYFGINSEMIELRAEAVMNTILGDFAVSGEVRIIYDQGLVGAFQLGLSTNDFGTGLFKFQGTFQLELNTTAVEQTIRVLDVREDGSVAGLKDGTIAPFTLRVAIAGELQIAGFVSFKGSAGLTISPDGFEAYLNMNVDLAIFGSLKVIGNARIANEDGEIFFAMRIRATFSFGIGDDFGVYGDIYVAVNTHGTNTYFGVGPSSFAFELVGQVKVVVLNAEVTGRITYENGVFAMSFSGSLNFFNFVSINVSGYVDSQGNFSVTGNVSWSLNIFILRLQGEFSLSFSNSGFSLRVSGSVDIRNPLGFLFGPKWITLVSLSGEVAITSTSALLSITAKILFISIDVDIFFSWDGVGARDIMKVEEGDTLDLGGENRVLSVNDMEIFPGATVKNPGGTITFAPSNGGNINIGNGSAGNAVTVDKGELGRIEDGTAGLIFGNNGESYNVQIGSQQYPGDLLNVKDPITIYNNGGSGDTHINSQITGNSDAFMKVYGSGNTVYISQDVTMGSSIEFYDSVVLNSAPNSNGVIDLVAGTGGSGNIVLGSGGTRLDGNGDGTDDYLVLSALGGGNVLINSTIGQIDAPDGLVINAGNDVTITGDVTIDGDLIINATGDIVFGGDLTLLNGGSLIISGANSVSFNEAQSVISLYGTEGGVPGDILIVADNMQLPATSDTATGAGFITLLPREVSRRIELASPIADSSVGALRLSVEELQLLGSGWQHLQIGYKDTDGFALSNTGPILIGGATRTDYTILSPASIHGGSIHVVDYPDNDRVFRTMGPLDLIVLGDITIDNETHVGLGAPENLNVYAETGSISQTEPVSAFTGVVSYFALQNVYQSADIYSGGALITVTAEEGEIVMADGTVSLAEVTIIAPVPASEPGRIREFLGGGVIDYRAGTDIYVSIVEGGNSIDLHAGTHLGQGAIFDNLTLDVAGVDNNLIGGYAILTAQLGIGLASDAINTAVDHLELTNTTSGGVFIQETDSVELVFATASLPAPSSNGVEGAVVVDSIDGLMTVSGPVAAYGHIRLNVSFGSILANANITSVDKNISVLAFVDFTASTDVDITTSTGATIDVEATTGSVILSETSDILTDSGDIRINAGQNVLIGGLVRTSTSVSISAIAGWIRDGDTNGTMDIIGSELRLVSYIGAGQLDVNVNPIETTVAVISARVGSEGLNILETDALIIGDTEATIGRVNSNATTTAVTDVTQSDLTSINNGSIVVRTLNGDLVFADGSAPNDDISVEANGSGRILLEAIGNGTSISFHADIISGSGEISMLADLNVTSTGTADILSGSSGTIDVEARNGSITYSVTSDQRTGFGDIRFNAEINITLGGLTHTEGDVSGTAVTGWIRDGDSDGTVDIEANELRLWAEIGVGQLGAQVNPIETTVTTMSARAGVEGINILETDDLIVNASDVTIQRVLPDASVVSVTDEARVDVTTYENGSIVVRTINGDMYLVGGADASVRTFGPPIGEGNILLETIGQGTSIEIYKNIISDSGDITLLAAWDIISRDTASIATNILGTIELEATKGSIDLSQATDIINYQGDIKLFADTDILLGGEVRTQLNVWIYANSGSVFDQVRDGRTDVIADKLVVYAGSGIGQKRNDFEFTVNELTIETNEDGMYLMGNKTLTLRDGIPNLIYRVNPDASTSVRIEESEGEGLDSADGALLELRRGDLILNRAMISPTGLRLILREGGLVDARGESGPDILADNFEVTADFVGNSSNPVESELAFLSGDLQDGLNLYNAGDLDIGPGVDVAGLSSAFGSISVHATGGLVVEGLNAAGAVTLTSESGSVLGGADENLLDIMGSSVALSAVDGFGTTGDGDLDVDADILTLVNSGFGSAYFDLNGDTVLASTDLAGPGSFFVRVLSGDLTVSGVNSIYGGDLKFQVRGALTLQGDLAVSGQISMTAESISGEGTAVESTNGSILLRSRGAISFDAVSLISAGNGMISTISGTNTVIGLMQSGVRIDIQSHVELSGSGSMSSPTVRLFSGAETHYQGRVYAYQFSQVSLNTTRFDVFDYLSEEESRISLTVGFP